MTTSSPTASQLAWLSLELTNGIGPVRAWKMLDALGSVEGLWDAQVTRLLGFGFPQDAATELVDGTSRKRAEEEWERTVRAGAQILTPDDAAYPERLKAIYDPPLALWCRGDVSLLSRAGIAVVGTRAPTPYGAGMSEMLSRDLAARGLVIFSGMARGVDTHAHLGALAARGKTVAVWGTGVDIIYPKENKRLAEDILANGAIISELPMGTAPATQNFPTRNRILSGLSVGVLVVEGSEQSGTRITARCAVEQGREVFAVPGNATNKQSWAPNTLIKQGAKLTATWEDVWEDLPSSARLELDERAKAEAASRAAVGAGPGGDGPAVPESPEPAQASLYTAAPAMGAVEAVVYDLLRRDEATQLDLLMDRLADKISPAEIFTALFELELAGKVRQLPGKNYVKSF